MLGQGYETPRDEVACGLISGHEKLDQEHSQFGLAELFAIDLRSCELRDDVIEGGGTALGGETDEVLPHLELHRPAFVGRHLSVAWNGRLGPLVEGGPASWIGAEQATDHLERERDAECRHDVERLSGHDVVKESDGDLANGLVEGTHSRWLEARLDESPIPSVGRRVSVHHRRRTVIGVADLIDQDPCS